MNRAKIIVVLIAAVAAVAVATFSDQPVSVMGFDVTKPDPMITRGIGGAGVPSLPSTAASTMTFTTGTGTLTTIVQGGIVTSTSATAMKCPRFVYGMTPTAGQWNACFDSKQDKIQGENR